MPKKKVHVIEHRQGKTYYRCDDVGSVPRKRIKIGIVNCKRCLEIDKYK